MKGCKKSKLSRYVLAALTVGMFSMVPVAYALPVAITDGSYTNVGGANISTNSVTETMGISSGSSHNVMNWKTFSIANGEKVQFDTNNYLNLVRGASKSEINGALTGGGTIYLINPNGILFGSTAQVNVGNLVASTRAIDKVDQSVFSGGGNPLATAATTAAGDIINLGKLQTTSLVLEGNNITIQNAADITSNGSTPLTSAVTAKAAGIITVGHAVAETTTRSFTIGGTATDKTVHDYKNATVAASGYAATDLAGTAKSVTESMLVDNVYDLQNMDAKLAGNYMLSGNIDASETNSWNTGAGFSPVGSWGSKFTGSFDGACRTISGLTINRSSTDNVGLFGYVNGSVIQSVGLAGGSITGAGYVGGVAGKNDGTIQNTYNMGAVSGKNNVGGVAGLSNGSITNALWANDLSYKPETGKTAPNWAVGNIVDSDKGETLATMKQAATYESWKDDSGREIVAATGGAGTAWRIYAGNTTPLLTSFFKGVVTVTGLDNRTVTYNGTTQKADLSGVTYSPADIDTGHILTGVRNVGAYSAIYSDQQGYDLVDSGNHTLTITPLALQATLTGKTGNTYVFTKTYDGTNSVTKDLVLGTTYTFDNAVSGDTVSIAANSSGIYANKNVGDDKTITFTGITLTGADAGNYTIATTLSGNVGQITKKNITASLNAVSGGTYVFTREYNGQKNVTQALDNNYSFAAGAIESEDTVSLTAGTSAYTDKNVGDTKEITFGGLALDGEDKGNYNLTTTSLTGNVGQITKKNITVSLNGSYVFTKTYDGGTDVKQALGTNYSFATGDIEKGDTVSLTAGTSAYTDKNVGDTKEITFGNLVLGDAAAGNYNLTTESLTGDVGQITKKNITASLNALGDAYVFTKIYDGGTDVKQALGNNYSFATGNIVSGETVGLTAGTGAYTDKNVGDTKEITFGGLALDGADKGNYNLTTTELSGSVGQITKKNITASLNALSDVYVFTKIYDGGTDVKQALGNNYSFATGDVESVDANKVSLTAGTGAYTDKNVGNTKKITFGSLALGGDEAGNYNLTTTELTGNVGRIEKKTIAAEIKSGSTITKEYDGTDVITTALAKDSNYVLTDVVSGDDLSLDTAKTSGTYTGGKDAGDNLNISFTGLKLTGADQGNYALTNSEMNGNYGQITPKTLTATLTGDNAFTKVYDGTTAVSQALGTNYALDGIMADSDKVLLSAGSGAYNDKNAGDNKTITFSGLTLTGTGAGNYTIASTLSGAVGQITRRTITGTLASGYSFDKVYDGTTTATLGNGYTLSGVAAGDKVPLTAAKGFYDSSAIGDRTVTFSGFSINDGNYLLSMADSLSGKGKITSGSQDHNYSDALTGVSSSFGANPSDGYTIFGGAPEDYVPRAVTKNNGQSYQVGVSQVTQTWYNGPTTITIINGGITLPKGILLGSTYDTRTVVIKGGNGYEI